MQKTTKSLLTKIFVLLTVIFCVFALALGAIGCAKEEEAKTVASMVVNGNVITVTYTNGDKQDLVIDNKQEPAKECGHNSYIEVGGGVMPVFELVDIADIPEDVCAMKLMSCTVCDHVYAEYVEHKLEKDAHTDPTCTTKGYDGKGCVNVYDINVGGVIVPTTCPFIKGAATDPLNHVKDGVSMYEKVTSISGCYDPAVQAYVCSLCGDVDEKGEDGRTAPTIIPCPTEGNHMADATWTVVDHPTATTAGKITGKCTVCGKVDAEITLPAATAENGYTFDIPGCEAGETVKTTTLKNYRGYTYKLEENHFQKHYVTVGDEKFYFAEEGTYTYSQLGLSADMFSGSVIPDCQTEKMALVKCEACQKNVGVWATGEHKYATTPDKDGETVITKAPTCTEAGYKARYSCTVDGCTSDPMVKADDVIAALGHEMVVVGDIARTGNNVTIYTECTRKAACGHSETISGTIKEEKAATCAERAYYIVEYTLNNEKVTTDKIYSGELAKHTVTVGEAKFNFEEEGTYTYLQLGLSADMFSGSEIPDCQTEKMAFVKCEACEKNVGVWATGAHKYNADPDKDGETVITKAATCTEAGYKARYSCTVDGCTSDPMVKADDKIAALGHEMVVVGDIARTGNNVTIYTECTRKAACGHSETISGTIKEEKAATCAERAYYIVEYTLNNEKVTTDKIYSGDYAKHKVTVGEAKVEFEEEGTYTYLQLGLSADMFSGSEIPDCQTEKMALVKCEACQKNVGVWATGEHKYNAEPDKNPAGEVITKEAGCVEDGYTAKYTCTAGCGHELVKEADVIKAKGHVWELDENSEVITNPDGTVTLSIKCKTCGEDDTITGTKNTEKSTPATCGKDAVNVYDYKINGEDASIEVVMTGTAKTHSAQPTDLLVFEATDDDGKVYICKGYVCENCKTLIIVSAEPKPAA